MKEGHRYTCSVTANDESKQRFLSILAKTLPSLTLITEIRMLTPDPKNLTDGAGYGVYLLK